MSLRVDAGAPAAAIYRRMLMAAAALLSVGFVMIYSASAVRAGRSGLDMAMLLAQGKGLLVGLAVCLGAARIPAGWYRRGWPLLAGAGLSLLAAVLFLGTRVNGAARWFRWGGINVQPSEVAKPLLILVLAAILAGAVDGRARLWWRVLAGGGLALAMSALVAVEPDLGSAALLAAAAFAILLAGGMWAGWSAVALGLGALAFALGFERFGHLRQRLADWSAGGGFHTNASVDAIGSGGLWGLGLGRGAAKLDYLPEAHTDFIFAMIGQELGLAGGLAVLGAFAFFVFQGLRLAWILPDRFGALVAFGVAVMIGGQALFNMGVVTGLLPPKGIQLPFVSFGSSGLVVNLAMLGLVAAAVRGEGRGGPLKTTAPGDGRIPVR